jgi:hypothetical protein
MLFGKPQLAAGMWSGWPWRRAEDDVNDALAGFGIPRDDGGRELGVDRAGPVITSTLWHPPLGDVFFEQAGEAMVAAARATEADTQPGPGCRSP